MFFHWPHCGLWMDSNRRGGLKQICPLRWPVVQLTCDFNSCFESSATTGWQLKFLQCKRCKWSYFGQWKRFHYSDFKKGHLKGTRVSFSKTEQKTCLASKVLSFQNWLRVCIFVLSGLIFGHRHLKEQTQSVWIILTVFKKKLSVVYFIAEVC